MIYFCADDYGLNKISSERIKECIEKGILNKVSVFPNFDLVDFSDFGENVRLSLHLNLVEGKCMAQANQIPLLADENGNFKHTFGGLFKLNFLNKKEFENQLYKEIKAQILYWKSVLPQGREFCVDSHQHTHMIPVVFKTLLTVLKDENIDLKYLRIPTEPVMAYVKCPSLYFTYSPVNIIKQWLINFLCFFNKKYTKKSKVPYNLFMGILFSGKMDKRVLKILPHYIRLAEKKGMDAEILFHPGYLEEREINLEEKNIVFEKFYLSQNRKTEFDSVTNILKGSAK